MIHPSFEVYCRQAASRPSAQQVVDSCSSKAPEIAPDGCWQAHRI